MSGERWGEGGDGNSFAFAKLPPGPHQLPRELVRENQRRRILFAALDVFADRGFAAATVQDLIRGAHVSRATFYEIFVDKEECMAALHDELVAWLWEQVLDVLAEAGSWEDQVRVAVARTLRLLVEDPRIAAVCAFEAPAGPPRVRDCHDRVVGRLCDALRTGRGESPHGDQLPEILEQALICGAIHQVGRTVVYGHGPDPSALVTELPELMLVPYRA